MARKKVKIKYYIDESMQFYYLTDGGKIFPVDMLADDEKYINSIVKYGGCDDAAQRGEHRIPKKFLYAISEDEKIYLVQKDRLVSVEELKKETERLEEQASEICTLSTKLYAAQNHITDMFEPKSVQSGKDECEVNEIPYQVAKAILLKYRLFKHGCEYKVVVNEPAEVGSSRLAREFPIDYAKTKSCEDKMRTCYERATSTTQQPQTMIVKRNGKNEKVIIASTFSTAVSDKVGEGASEYVDLERSSNLEAQKARVDQLAFEQYALGGTVEEYAADRKDIVKLIEKCLLDMRNSSSTTERKCADVLDVEYIADATMDKMIAEEYIDDNLRRVTQTTKVTTSNEEKLKLCKSAGTKQTYYNLLNKGIGYFGIRLYRYLIKDKDKNAALLRLFGSDALPEEMKFVKKKRARGSSVKENLEKSKKK